MILDKELLVTLYGQNINHYESLGYDIPKQLVQGRKNRFQVPKGTKIKVKVDDLPDGSNEMIHCKCDYCGKEFDRMYCTVVRSHKNGNIKDSCGDKECIIKRNHDSKMLQYGSVSQIDICKQNNSNLGRNAKYTLDDFIKVFDAHGLDIIVELIDDVDHITVKDYIPYICRKHQDCGIQYQTLDGIKTKKHCCKYGAIESLIKSQSTVSILDVEKICMERNYILLTDRITSVDTPIEYVCNKHPEYGVQHTTLYGMLHYNCNCRLCAAEKYSGENHWNWRGGINNQNDTARKSWEYKQWRYSVYKRDHFTCQCCGKSIKEIKLNAHHILNFSDHEDLRYDLNNGITLCEECHSINSPNSFHSIYGTCNNTEEQLKEYITNRRESLTIQNE